jgi:hypothetical protein
MEYWGGRSRWGSSGFLVTSGLVLPFFRSEILGDWVEGFRSLRDHVAAPTNLRPEGLSYRNYTDARAAPLRGQPH